MSNFISRKRKDYVDSLLITEKSTISGRVKFTVIFNTFAISMPESFVLGVSLKHARWCSSECF
jgi:hypothetical protein